MCLLVLYCLLTAVDVGICQQCRNKYIWFSDVHFTSAVVAVVSSQLLSSLCGVIADGLQILLLDRCHCVNCIVHSADAADSV